MPIKAPRPVFDAASKQIDGTRNLDLQQALINQDSRIYVIERAFGLTGLDSDKKTKVVIVPPRADFDVEAGTGQITVSITNPEFIPGRGNPLKQPIYHRISTSPDPSFRVAVKRRPPSVQTHWPIIVPSGSKQHVRVESSYDGRSWTLPITKGPVTA